MYKLLLIHMPFAELKWPSLGLTQIQAVINEKLSNYFETKIIYINHEFVDFFGMSEYQLISSGPSAGDASLSADQTHSGLGDWMFRKEAFPEWEDNCEEYFKRFYNKSDKFKEYILNRRNEISDFLQQMIEKYELDKADIIGFTSMFQQQFSSFALARKLKEISPDIITVMGGSNLDYPVAQMISEKINYIDYTFSGSSLINFPEFLSCFTKGQMEGIVNIPGIYSKNFNKLIDSKLPSQAYGEEREINHVVWLDYDSYFESINRIFKDNSVLPELYFETSRGCWWGEKVKCKFCDYNGLNMKFRAMEAENAVKYIQSLMRYAGQCKLFRSADSVLSKDYCKSVLSKVDIPDNTSIFYEVKVGLDHEDFKALVKSRILYVQAGIESLNTKNLKLMNKGTTAFDNIIFLKLCAEYGISVLWNLLTGIVDEDESIYNDYISIIPLLYHLYPPTGLWPVSYDKNCDYTVNSLKYGLRLESDIEVNSYLYEFSESLLKGMGYFYINLDKKNIYTPKKMKKIYLINMMIKQWITKWSSADKEKYPQLYISEIGRKKFILDTRFEKAERYDLDELDQCILKLCNKPISLEQLIIDLNDVEAEVIKHKIETYLTRKFLFYENHKYLNLIFFKIPYFPEKIKDICNKIPTHMQGDKM